MKKSLHWAWVGEKSEQDNLQKVLEDCQRPGVMRQCGNGAMDQPEGHSPMRRSLPAAVTAPRRRFGASADIGGKNFVIPWARRRLDKNVLFGIFIANDFRFKGILLCWHIFL